MKWPTSIIGRDVLLSAALLAPAAVAAVYFNVFDLLYAHTRGYEHFQLDEIASVVLLLGLAAFLFAIRRVAQVQREIRKRRLSEMKARRLAGEDPLTGLPNRRYFIESLGRWQTHLGPDDNCAIMMLDLDRFKPINDLYGHRAGDEVLRGVARRLKRIVADRGSVARLGGDEFGICRALHR